MNKVKLKAKVVNKRNTPGWLGCSYHITFKFELGNVVEKTVDIDQYYDMNLNETYLITMYRHSDGLHYFQPE